jgi:hypothetical protein
MRRRKVLVALALSLGTVGLTGLSSGGITANAAANALSISPANPAIGAPVVLSISNLPAGSVDFSVGGVPMGSAYVTGPTGEASITTALWSNGTFPVLATLNRYWGGVLTTTNFNGTVTVGTATPSTAPPLPTTSIAPTTTTPATTIPPTTVPPTGGIGRYLADLPVVTGIGRVGETLTCNFVLIPLSFRTVQWVNNAGESIPGESANTYVVKASDIGQAIGCVVNNGSGSLQSVPLVILNEAGALPTASISITRAGSPISPILSFSCLVDAGSDSVVGFRFLKFVEILKGVFTNIADSGTAKAGQPLSCTGFVENRVGRVALSLRADTSRQTVAPIAITGSGRVGRTLTCNPPLFVPGRQLIVVEWTYDNFAPPILGGPKPTSVGPSTYVVQRADIGRELRCRARFAGESASAFAQLVPEFWVYSAPVLARR